MTHPLPQSLAAIVKAEAENSWNDFRNKAIPGTEGTVQSGYFGYAAFPQTAYCHGFSAAAQFLFAHLSEPGEACGPHLMIQSSPLSADKEEYVPLTELLQVRAALASSEARVRILSEAVERLAKKYRRDTYANEIRDHACESCGDSDVIVPGFLCAIHAAEALLEVQR